MLVMLQAILSDPFPSDVPLMTQQLRTYNKPNPHLWAHSSPTAPLLMLSPSNLADVFVAQRLKLNPPQVFALNPLVSAVMNVQFIN